MENAFFKPNIGSKYYTEGISGKKVLVIGASFYCERKECPFFSGCTDEAQKDSRAYDESCPEYNKNEHILLSDCPTNELEQGIAYVKFGNSMSKLFFDAELHWDEFWERVSFTNFIQFILPHRRTYRRNISKRDIDALVEVVDKVNPDIMIVWGCVVNEVVKSLSDDEETKKRTQGYLCYWNHNGKEIAIVNPYHPVSSYYYSGDALSQFESALKKALAQ